jgi:hypothetical protein
MDINIKVKTNLLKCRSFRMQIPIVLVVIFFLFSNADNVEFVQETTTELSELLMKLPWQ